MTSSSARTRVAALALVLSFAVLCDPSRGFRPPPHRHGRLRVPPPPDASIASIDRALQLSSDDVEIHESHGAESTGFGTVGDRGEDEEERPPYDFRQDYTGKRRQLRWQSAVQPVPLSSEIALLRSGVLVRRGEFNRLKQNRAMQVRNMCESVGMTMSQGIIIRKQLLISNTAVDNRRYEQNLDYINRRLGCGKNTILQLSRELNLPPVGMIRAIIRSRLNQAYPALCMRDRKKLVKQIISEEDTQLVDEILSPHELEQLRIAKANDVIAYQETPTETNSVLWEQDLYNYLDEHGINYVSESTMRDAGCSLTPDCLFLDDVYINNRLVRWIDCKSYYASGLRKASLIVKKIKKQSAKYTAEYGEPGAMIFKHGYSRQLARKYPNVLFLDPGPLRITDVAEPDV